MEAITDLDLTPVAELTDADLDTLADLEFAGHGSKLPEPAAWTFDYSGVSSKCAQAAEETAERIRTQMRDSVIEIGQALITVKAMMPGKFGDWIKHQFGMSQSSAENYMNVARHFSGTPRVIEALPQRTIYRLAAKGTPEDVREAVKKEITSGAIPNRDDIEKRLDDAREAEKAKREEERQKAAAERMRKREEREWQERAKALKTAGKTDAEIDAEQKLWISVKAKNERDMERAKRTKEKQQAELEARNREAEEECERRKASARAAAEFLKEHLGAAFGRFQALASETDGGTLMKAIMDD